MAGWMSYVMVVSLLLGLAALALERSAQLRQRPTRWLWGASMIASVMLPVIVASVSLRMPPLTGVIDPAAPQTLVALRQLTVSELSPSIWLTAAAGPLPASADLSRLLLAGWIAGSMMLLLAIMAGGLHVSWLQRRWETGSMAGVPIHISENAGPAVVGLLDPHIVVPRWLTQCPSDIQELVIAHELGHLDAHDARLVTIALGLLVCTPWNLPLWWQLRRLRFAIEIDCDARVLRRGYDVSRYGETLIAVGERRSASVAMVAAMSEPTSLLERRIRAMVRRKAKYAGATAVALACLGIAFAVGAAEVSPPDNDGSGKPAPHESADDAKVLDGYVGFYQLNDRIVLTITRAGQQLNAKMIGQQALPIQARSRTEFTYKDGLINFMIAPDGQTTSLILHAHGVDMPMKRIDAATARAILSQPLAPRPVPAFEGGALIMPK